MSVEVPGHAQIAVAGGGIAGASTAYHLAKLGRTDVVLLEQGKLTCGTTWHAAGLLPLFNLSYSVGQIHKYSVSLYNSLEAETGQKQQQHRQQHRAPGPAEVRARDLPIFRHLKINSAWTAMIGAMSLS